MLIRFTLQAELNSIGFEVPSLGCSYTVHICTNATAKNTLRFDQEAGQVLLHLNKAFDL